MSSTQRETERGQLVEHMGRHDPHLATGSYDPEAYWSARAERGSDSDIETVCIFGASSVENRAADRVQRGAMLRALRRVELRDCPVLEYGCGIGRWAPLFAHRGAHWHGVDLSAAMCEHARSGGRDLDVRKVEEDEIPHADDTFGLVYSVTVVHHNPYERQERILDEMLRVLRPDGTLVLFEDLGATGAFNMFPRTLAGWRDLLAERDLELVHHEGVRYSILRGGLARVRAWFSPGRASSAAAQVDAADLDLEHDVTPQSAIVEPRTAQAPRRSWMHKLVDRLDLWFDPWIARCLPRSAHTSAVMVFRRRPRSRPRNARVDR